MKEIPLTKGFVATVDDADYNRLMEYKWQHAMCDKKEYARRRETINGKSHTIYMHREIMGITDSKIYVDHRNSNGLCNERWNLRECNNQQNQACRKQSKKYSGVYQDFRKKIDTFCTRIKFNGKVIYVGSFRTDIEAAIAYNKKAKELFGEFASINIIEEEI